MFISWGILLIGSLVLGILILKIKAEGLLKKFLLITGLSIVGFPVFVILHNFIYGLLIYFFGQDFWERIGLGDEPFFFILAVIVCPLGFLVGVIGTIVLLVKKRKKEG
jgi:hypothetical protein